MKYRNNIINKLEHLEGNLKTLKRMVQRQESVAEFIKVIDSLEVKVEEIQSFIRLEPRDNNEL